MCHRVCVQCQNLDGNKAVYKDDDDHKIEMTFKGSNVVVSTDSGSAFCGMNAYINGTYKKSK